MAALVLASVAAVALHYMVAQAAFLPRGRGAFSRLVQEPLRDDMVLLQTITEDALQPGGAEPRSAPAMPGPRAQENHSLSSNHSLSNLIATLRGNQSDRARAGTCGTQVKPGGCNGEHRDWRRLELKGGEDMAACERTCAEQAAAVESTLCCYLSTRAGCWAKLASKAFELAQVGDGRSITCAVQGAIAAAVLPVGEPAAWLSRGRRLSAESSVLHHSEAAASRAQAATAPKASERDGPQRDVLRKVERSGVPATPGCYIKMPSGCPQKPGLSKGPVGGWRRDTFGELNRNASRSRKACVQFRKKTLDESCGTEDTKMLYIPEAPTDPGCYMWMPAGCPAQPRMRKVQTWRRDVWGEQHKRARDSSDACLVDRHQSFGEWCGSGRVRALFVPSPPTQPGCHVWIPAGCPRSNYSADSWRLDSFGQKRPVDEAGEKACLEQRKKDLVNVCNTLDVRMTYIPPKSAGKNVEKSEDMGSEEAEEDGNEAEEDPLALHSAGPAIRLAASEATGPHSRLVDSPYLPPVAALPAAA